MPCRMPTSVMPKGVEHNAARRGRARPGVARHGWAGRGKARQGEARRGKAFYFEERFNERGSEDKSSDRHHYEKGEAVWDCRHHVRPVRRGQQHAFVAKTVTRQTEI